MKGPERTATLNVAIPNRTLATELLEQWSEQAGASLNILRARVTVESAAYELEIRGRAATVARIVRQSAPWDRSRRFLSPVAAGEPA